MKRRILWWGYLLIFLPSMFLVFESFGQNPPPCTQNYSWATWSNFKGKEATGTIQVNGKPVNVTMSANYDFSSTPTIYGFTNLSGYNGVSAIPNSTVPKTKWSAPTGGETKMCFSEPVSNPLLLISSLGSFFSPDNKESVTLRFSEPYVVTYNATGITNISDYTITGEEGYAILLFPGTFTCLTIFSVTPEDYTNITWGLQPPIFPVKITEDSKTCGSVDVTASGGSTYKWSGGKNPNSATNTFDKSGVYSVTATNTDGCTSIALKVINVPSKPNDAIITKTICQGETYEGYGSSGIYKDTFKTSGGCDSTRILTLSVVGLPQVSLENSYETCEGKAVNIAPTITPSNFPVTYQWSSGQTTPSINVTTTGNYTLTVSNGGCKKDFTTKVSVGKPPTLKPNETLCFSAPPMVLEAGTIDNSDYSYFWSVSNSSNPKLTIFQPGTYQVKVQTVGGGCESSRTITVLPTPIVDLGPDKYLCEGENFLLRPINAVGNPISYSWSNGSTGVETKVTKSGQYILTATQGTCSGKDTIWVTFNSLPNVEPEGSSCNDKPLLAYDSENNNFRYLWDSGATTRSIEAQPDGIYHVKITNQFDCTLTKTITVSGPCSPRLYVPDIFTPNGDSVNDSFKAILVGGEIISLTIFNRWGHPVYFEEGKDPQWKGTFKETDAIIGTYVYLLRYQIKNNSTVSEQRGVIILER